jgi:hypothetical protein
MTGYPLPKLNNHQDFRQLIITRTSRNYEGIKLYQGISLAYQGIISQTNLTFSNLGKMKMGHILFQLL